jgi:hypothetical protein
MWNIFHAKFEFALVTRPQKERKKEIHELRGFSNLACHVEDNFQKTLVERGRKEKKN